MSVTPDDIESEHEKALAGLSREQHWALSRIQRAYQESHFNHRRICDNLSKIFECEARARNEAEALRGADPTDAQDIERPNTPKTEPKG